VTGKPLQSLTQRSPGSDVISREVRSGSVSFSQARKNGSQMWVVGLSPLMSPSAIFRPRAAAAARRFRGHRVRHVSFRDTLGSVRPEPMSTRCARARAPLMRFFQRLPLCRHEPLRPADPIRRPGEEVADLSRGAVHAVSHDSDGFVRRRPRGLVASHYRLWGSPGFVPKNDVTAATRHSSQAPTLRSVPLLTKWTPSPTYCWVVHRMPCPSRGWLFFRPAG
jgi:hypothetical protein